MNKYIKIEPKVMEYAWGNKDFIPTLINKEIDGNPKAELWMGTHSGAPSLIEGSDKTLEDYLKEHVCFFSSEHVQKFNDNLPFLFKILAIEKPLSIQCHPNYKEAKIGYDNEKEYRENNPRSLWNYKDDNRKAEVIFALTDITAMCSFLSDEEILTNLKTYIPKGFDKYISSKFIDNKSKAEVVFDYLYKVDKEILKELITELLENVKNCENKKGSFFTKEGIINRVKDEYPLDSGLFAPLFLNVVHLKKNEALYLEPRLLHAYVYGNGIELMSASDNVLRGGLTNKKMDVDELMKVMRISQDKIELCNTRRDKYNREIVETPTEEFTLLYFDKGDYQVKTKNLEMLLFLDDSVLTIDKKDVEIKKGDVYVICANTIYSLKNKGQVFVATC
ncbi:MAG: mannose-6-phosphate isomerase, class I [Pleomorphochaeta sp.]